MIESLAEHGVNAMDLAPALMTTHTVANPEYDPAEAKRKALEEKEEQEQEKARVKEEKARQKEEQEQEKERAKREKELTKQREAKQKELAKRDKSGKEGKQRDKSYHFVVLPTGLGQILGGAEHWESVPIAGVDDEVAAHCGLFIRGQNLDYDGLVERVGRKVLEICDKA